MRGALGYAALSCALGLASSKPFWWSGNVARWTPAQETPVFQPLLGMNIEPPAPTPAPHVERDDLHARDPSQNTCAYISGVKESSLWCAASAHCVYNSHNSHIGCCDDTASFCAVWTTCYDQTQNASFTTDNGFTLWCGNGSYPHCLTHMYYDAAFSGYTLLGCGVAAGTDKVWYTPVPTSASSSSPSSTSSSSSSTSSSSSSSSPSSSSSLFQSNTPTPSPDSSSSPPVGPIVGGVVGGLAAIALIILGIWALIRQNNQQKRKAAEAAAAGGGAPYQQPPPPGGPQDPSMSQGYYAAALPVEAAAGFDPRSSVAKPPVAYSTTTYPSATDATSLPHSPAPAYQQGTPSPPPPQQQMGQFGQHPQQHPQPGYEHQQQYGNVSPPLGGYQQPAPQPAPQPQPHQYSTELPTQRGDGQLTELQG